MQIIRFDDRRWLLLRIGAVIEKPKEYANKGVPNVRRLIGFVLSGRGFYAHVRRELR